MEQPARDGECEQHLGRSCGAAYVPGPARPGSLIPGTLFDKVREAIALLSTLWKLCRRLWNGRARSFRASAKPTAPALALALANVWISGCGASDGLPPRLSRCGMSFALPIRKCCCLPCLSVGSCCSGESDADLGPSSVEWAVRWPQPAAAGTARIWGRPGLRRACADVREVPGDPDDRSCAVRCACVVIHDAERVDRPDLERTSGAYDVRQEDLPSRTKLYHRPRHSSSPAWT